jgi:hypothetical protein
MSLPNAWIDRLFSRLAVCYGNKFADMWRDQDLGMVKNTWCVELAGLTADQIRNALDVLPAKHPTWPPTLFEFIALCRPTAIDPEVAYHEALRGTYARRDGEPGSWSCKAIYWASIDVSAHDVLNCTWPQIRGRWTQALERRLADPNLPAIPEPPPRLAPPAEPIERNVQRVTEMLAVLTGPKKNRRSWVQKLLDRKAAGQPVDDYAYRMALKSADVR